MLQLEDPQTLGLVLLDMVLRCGNRLRQLLLKIRNAES